MAYDFLGNAIEAGRIAPTQPAPVSMFNFEPKQKAVEDNFMSKDEVRQALANVPDKMAGLQKLLDGGFKLEGYEEMKAPAPVEQGFGAGFLEKTAESFKSGISRIGEAGVGLAEGKYTFPEAAARGAAGSLESFFSPLAGAVGQSVEQFTPDSVKQGVSEFVAPAIQKGKDYYASQSPEIQRDLGNIGVGGEVLLNFLGGGAAAKTVGSQTVKKVATETGKAITESGKALGRGISKTGDAIATIPEYGISIATGLSRDAQQTIKNTPQLYKKARTGEITRETIFDETKNALDTRLDELSELGKSYQDLRTGKVVGKSDELNDAFSRATTKTDVVDLPTADRNAIAETKKYIDEIQGELTDRQLLAMRKKIDSTISWDKGVSSEGQAVVRGIRANIDDLAKSKIVGLAERDAKFAPEIKFLNTVKNTIYNSKGEIKDNALSSINNLTGKGKEFKIERFEKILPGITQKINALKAFEEVQGIGEIKTGSIARQGGGIAAGATVLGPVGAAIGFILTHPGVASRILETYGMAKQSIKALISKTADRKIMEKAASIMRNANKAVVEKLILTAKTIANPFKDISFIKKLGSGQVKGLSPEATNIMKGVKTPKEAMARAKQKDIANEVTKVYITRMSADDIDALEASVAKKDFPPVKNSATVKPIAPKVQKMETIKNINTSSGKYNSGRLEHQNGFLDYEISGNNMDIDLIKVIDKQKGTGTKLMKEAEKIAKEKGLKQLRLSSQPMDSSISQKDLNSFYEKNGFINNGDNYFVKDLR